MRFLIVEKKLKYKYLLWVEKFLFRINMQTQKFGVPSFCEVMFSKTLFVFYGVPFIIFLFIALFDVKDVFCGYICGC